MMQASAQVAAALEAMGRAQKAEGLTAVVIKQGAFYHLGRSPLELQGGGDAGLRVQHDGVVGMLPAAPPELVLHILHAQPGASGRVHTLET